MRRRKRRSLFENAAAGDSAEALQAMSWQEFELLVGEGFRRRGYAVKESGGGGADGGVDLVLTKDGEKYFVQCKQWRAYKVGVTTVRELYGVMAAHGAAHGFVVTSGRFTKEASAFARGRNIRLVDGAALMQLLREARRKTTEVRTPAFNEAASHAPVARSAAATSAMDQKAEHAPPASPACPQCGKLMVQRTAKRGASVGKTFWGCSEYAAGCRGTREIAGT